MCVDFVCIRRGVCQQSCETCERKQKYECDLCRWEMRCDKESCEDNDNDKD